MSDSRANQGAAEKPEISFEFVGQHSRRRRVRFVREEPGGLTYVEEQQDGDDWRPLGNEAVAGLDVTVDAGGLDVLAFDCLDEAASESVRSSEVATR